MTIMGAVWEQYGNGMRNEWGNYWTRMGEVREHFWISAGAIWGMG